MHIIVNLRPGANTLYWIENGIFQTSVPYVVTYLDKFLASEETKLPG